jgi:hypothetical protein
MLRMNLKPKIGKWFVIVTAISLIIGFYIKDYKMALAIFFGYAGLRILLNFMKRDEPTDYY